uniref:AraC family transcriptional regulator n=1 Tax=Panagrellus redivivus TaxID=6233 RepID=A0A7E4VZP8_PANRE
MVHQTCAAPPLDMRLHLGRGRVTLPRAATLFAHGECEPGGITSVRLWPMVLQSPGFTIATSQRSRFGRRVVSPDAPPTTQDPLD